MRHFSCMNQEFHDQLLKSQCSDEKSQCSPFFKMHYTSKTLKCGKCLKFAQFSVLTWALFEHQGRTLRATMNRRKGPDRPESSSRFFKHKVTVACHPHIQLPIVCCFGSSRFLLRPPVSVSIQLECACLLQLGKVWKKKTNRTRRQRASVPGLSPTPRCVCVCVCVRGWHLAVPCGVQSQ